MCKSAPLFCALLLSLSARRAWIEIRCDVAVADQLESLSARRAWIEITDDVSTGGKIKSSLSARRAWIEILSFGHIFPYNQGRSPQGERG